MGVLEEMDSYTSTCRSKPHINLLSTSAQLNDVNCSFADDLELQPWPANLQLDTIKCNHHRYVYF